MPGGRLRGGWGGDAQLKAIDSHCRGIVEGVCGEGGGAVMIPLGPKAAIGNGGGEAKKKKHPVLGYLWGLQAPTP